MNKNYISWKRAPCGSIVEILLPVLLMLIIVYAKTKADTIKIDNYTLYSLRHPLYPVGKIDSATNNYTVDLQDQPAQLVDLLDFMNYTEYLNLNQSLKIPVNASKLIDNYQEQFSNATGISEEFIDDVQNITAQTAVVVLENIEGVAKAVTDTAKEILPIGNLTNIIDWEALQILFQDLGVE